MRAEFFNDKGESYKYGKAKSSNEHGGVGMGCRHQYELIYINMNFFLALSPRGPKSINIPGTISTPRTHNWVSK